MNQSISLQEPSSINPYSFLLDAFTLIPLWHYLVIFLFIFSVFLYHYLDFHFFQDVFAGFKGCPVTLTYNSNSHIYHNVVSKCRVLHSRYLATPWLASPHLQNFFLTFLGNPPDVTYQRELFRLADGGTIALDWGVNSMPRDDASPILMVLPGLTSDPNSSYIRHLTYNTFRLGWNVVVSNHRGLGGVPITSDFIYNCGWTNDVREVTNHLHHRHPNAPLFIVGTSIGANILVKYLGEDGENVPVSGAAAICCPWDFLIGDRFIRRTLLQRLYDKALTLGLQWYSEQHRHSYSRLSDWEGKMHSIRHYHKICDVGKFETVDAFYRRNSSAIYVCNVSVPLLCINALDDPLCTAEAIPWDECRENVNVVLATTTHGSHLAYFECITASGIWWVRAVDEFFSVLNCSEFKHKQKDLGAESTLDSTLDHDHSSPNLMVALVKLVALVKAGFRKWGF
ncbi:hypothetical protein ACLB2K_038527 [Fragaria x ananassa]